MAEAAGSTHLGPGSLLENGKYRLTEKLGEGGMGTVFLAVHERLGREVAIKTLRPEFGSSPEILGRFQREAEAVTRIGHANIVAVYDFGRTPDGGLYYVMEKVNGETLTQRMRRMPLSDAQVADVFTQLLSALAAAHNVSVVHRDLKPDNIIVVDRGNDRLQVKLLDFGVAKIRDEQSTGPKTTAGALMGTPKYMAPEQVKGAQSVDGRADIYAAGVILYEALCGKPPFEGKMMALLAAHVGQEPTPPSVKAQEPGGLQRPSLPWQQVDQVVLKSLEKDPAQRYQDCRSLAADLQVALASAISAAASAALPQVAAPTKEAAPAEVVKEPPAPRPIGLYVGAGVVGLLLLGGIGVLGVQLFSPSTPPEDGATTAKATNPPKKTDPNANTKQGEQTKGELSRAIQILDQAMGGGSEERRAALSAIEESRAKKLLPRVIAALQEESPTVRLAAVSAAAALGEAGDESLLAALKAAEENASEGLLAEIAASRLTLGDASAAETLSTLAKKSRDANIRLRATLSLSQRGRARASDLRKAYVLADKAGGLRKAQRRQALTRLYILEDAGIRKEMSAGLESAELRQQAAEILTLARDPRGADELLKLAAASTPSLAIDALSILSEVGDARAKAQLETLLANKDGEERIRARAVTALGRLGGGAAFAKPLLSDPKQMVALAASVVLQGASP